VYLQRSGKICDFPPFQLDLENSKTDGTIFEGHVRRLRSLIQRFQSPRSVTGSTGFCRPDYEFEASLARFNSQRESVLEMVRTQEGLEPDVRALMLSDYQEFYQIVNDRDGMHDWIMEKCWEDSRG